MAEQEKILVWHDRERKWIEARDYWWYWIRGWRKD